MIEEGLEIQDVGEKLDLLVRGAKEVTQEILDQSVTKVNIVLKH